MYIVHALDGARIVVYRMNNAHMLNRQKHSLYIVQYTVYNVSVFNRQKQSYIQYTGGYERLAMGCPVRVRPFFKPYRAPPLSGRTR